MKRPHVLSILKDKLSFLVASIALFSFVMGNMIGQHGFYVFWKSVLGKEDESLVVFMGTVPPISQIPDYTRWAQYGGGSPEHTFRQVPRDLLTSLPPYDASVLNKSSTSSPSLARLVYSVGHLGSYETGGDHDGSHAGVDIRVPIGTPVQSIANGIVVKTSLQESGYGHYVLIKHPNVPDPKNPNATTTLWSTYAHLDSILVAEGQVVHKGEQVATSGKTGFASGPHLHFQVDTDDAPFHPYWVFSDAEMREAGYTFIQAINRGLHQERGQQYTVSPLLYAEKYETYTAPSIASLSVSSSQSVVSSSASSSERAQTTAELLRQRRSERIALRQASRRLASIGGGATPTSLFNAQSSSSSHSSPSVSVAIPSSLVTQESSPSSLDSLPSGSSTDVTRVTIDHGGFMSPAWQKVRISLVNANGEVVTTPTFTGKLYLGSEFGTLDVRPKELSAADFTQGKATVNVLTRGTKTVFLSVRGAFTAVSAPFLPRR